PRSSLSISLSLYLSLPPTLRSIFAPFYHSLFSLPFPTPTETQSNTNMAPAIFSLRFWMAFVTLVNLSIVIAYHGYLIRLINMNAEGEGRYEYYWGNYAVIIASVILFPAYLYSILGKKPLVSNKYIRAVLMLLPALFLIGVQLHQVDVRIKRVKEFNEFLGEEFSKIEPFSCASSDGSEDPNCVLVQSYTFIPVVTGFFVIIEVAVTLFRGPLHSPKEAYL
ncbi:MAG: hypothetical protein JOS17DRAFT_190091, partial [Linnemannia elongata]